MFLFLAIFEIQPYTPWFSVLKLHVCILTSFKSKMGVRNMHEFMGQINQAGANGNAKLVAQNWQLIKHDQKKFLLVY